MAHGLTDSAASWDRVAAVLAPSYDVVRYGARGHGASDRAPAYSAELNTYDLIGLVRELELDRPVLIGHSMGSVHAALAAAELDVRALILEDPHWPEIPEDGTKDIGATRRSVTELAALPQAQRWAHGRAEHPTWADIDLEAWVQAQDQVDPDVVGGFNSWPATNRWRDHASKLDSPGLLVTGNRSPTVTPHAAAQARNRWAQLQTVQIKDAGHNVRRDQFEPYWRAVSNFLDTLCTRVQNCDLSPETRHRTSERDYPASSAPRGRSRLTRVRLWIDGAAGQHSRPQGVLVGHRWAKVFVGGRNHEADLRSGRTHRLAGGHLPGASRRQRMDSCPRGLPRT
jgi:N-formylmaleamate deformylase